jgi:signal transduction histidine kinase
MRDRSVRLAVGAAGTLVAIGAAWIALDGGAPPSDIPLNVAIGLTYLYGGLAIQARGTASRTGLLMTSVGFAWFVPALGGSSRTEISDLGNALADVRSVLILALVLAYPGGRLQTRADVVGVTVFAIASTAVNALYLTTTPLIINEGRNGLYVGLALSILATTLLVRRWLRTPAVQRAPMLPVLVAGAVFVIVVGVNLVRRLAQVSDATAQLLVAIKDLTPALIPISLLIGFYLDSEQRLRAVVDAQREAEAEVRRSRARIVEAADAERRRIERNLHDGAQQRLVALSLELRRARSRLSLDADRAAATTLDEANAQLRGALADLRELARGIHPAILTEAGLGPALRALAEESPVPVQLALHLPSSLPSHIGVAAYFIVAEALTNVAKYANAQRVEITATTDGGRVHLVVADDGRGGADPNRGSGLRGLADRVAAIDGGLSVDSPAGRGTRVTAELPLSAADRAALVP